MCGINGFIDKTLTKEEGFEVLTRMAVTTTHRGPDNTAYKIINDCYLAHNRLSIIDLSDEGNQPMHLDELTIVFNGEIYNYRELRSSLQIRGYNFKTQSDTEVILISYKEWGSQCVNYFIGMWAFAIYNEKENHLFCSRDRFGIKPFYYIHAGTRFYFSSEIKSLKKAPIFRNEINEIQIKKSIQLGWMFDREETLYKDILILEQACNLTLKNGTIDIKQYWTIPFSKVTDLSREALVQRFKDLFFESLNLHIRSDVPVGATLSGGIDSSSIVSSILSQKALDHLETFTIYYDSIDDIDERAYSNSVIEKYKASITAHYLKPKVTDVAEHFERITYFNDFPLLGSSPISQYFIMKEISSFGIKVILSGQGADDYLGGYMHTYYRLYSQLISEYKFNDLFTEIQFHVKYQNLGLNSLLKLGMKTLVSLLYDEPGLLKFEYKHGLINLFSDRHLIINQNLISIDKFDQVHEAMIKLSSLPNLLHYEDRNSMAFSIESRVPFLDHRLVELAFSLPKYYKINHGITKWILRESMFGILPEKIYHRKDKVGFVTPGETKWLRNDLKHLLETEFKDIPNINIKKLKKLKEEFLKGDNTNAKIMWRLATVQDWIQNQ